MAASHGSQFIDHLINHGLIPENCIHVILEMKAGEPIKIHYSVWEHQESSLEVLMGGTELIVSDMDEGRRV